MKKATNNGSMKQANRRLILDMIRRDPISRADIAQRIELTRASVTIITEELIGEGLIYEVELVHNNNKGRNPILLTLNPDGVRFGGIKLDNDRIEVGIVNIAGGTLSQTILPWNGASPRALLETACQILQSSGGELDSVGLCGPTPVDYEQGLLLNPPTLSPWHEVPVVETITAYLPDCPLHMENVSNALTLEEKYFGVNKDVPNFASLLVNENGIRLGVLLNDQLLRGAQGLGNAIGHTIVVVDGLPCPCGNHGCLEMYASMPALLQGSPFDSWHALVDQLGNSAAAQELLEREAKYLSVALLNTINMLDIEMVILKGDIAYNALPLCSLLNQRISGRIATRRVREDVLITSSEAPCSVRTAAMPAIHRFFH